jgi:hypothetical protein
MPSVFLMKLIDARVTTGNPATRPCTPSTSVPRTRHPCRDYNAYSVVWLMYSSTPHHCDIPGNGRMYAEYAVPTLAMYSQSCMTDCIFGIHPPVYGLADVSAHVVLPILYGQPMFRRITVFVDANVTHCRIAAVIRRQAHLLRAVSHQSCRDYDVYRVSC